MNARIMIAGFVFGVLIFNWGYQTGKHQNPAVYRLDPEIQTKLASMKQWEDFIDDIKPGHIALIGNGVWRKERYVAWGKR